MSESQPLLDVILVKLATATPARRVELLHSLLRVFCPICGRWRLEAEEIKTDFEHDELVYYDPKMKVFLDLPWTVHRESMSTGHGITLHYAVVRNAEMVNVARFPDNDYGFAVATLLAESPERMSQLKSLIANLPSSADGIPIIPGMRLYCPDMGYDDRLIVTAVHAHNAVSVESVDGLGRKVNRWKSVPAGNYYSTREAASAAKGSCA